MRPSSRRHPPTVRNGSAARVTGSPSAASAISWTAVRLGRARSNGRMSSAPDGRLSSRAGPDSLKRPWAREVKVLKGLVFSAAR